MEAAAVAAKKVFFIYLRKFILIIHKKRFFKIALKQLYKCHTIV